RLLARRADQDRGVRAVRGEQAVFLQERRRVCPAQGDDRVDVLVARGRVELLRRLGVGGLDEVDALLVLERLQEVRVVVLDRRRPANHVRALRRLQREREGAFDAGEERQTRRLVAQFLADRGEARERL